MGVGHRRIQQALGWGATTCAAFQVLEHERAQQSVDSRIDHDRGEPVVFVPKQAGVVRLLVEAHGTHRRCEDKSDPTFDGATHQGPVKVRGPQHGNDELELVRVLILQAEHDPVQLAVDDQRNERGRPLLADFELRLETP